MFRRLPASLPKDPSAPRDLEQLGYFVNDDDQIRSIKKPEQKYQWKVNRNDRVNDVFKEAMNACIRSVVKERLQNLGLETLRLPIGVAAHEKHIPIYISRGLRQKKRVIVVFGERNQELGILSYRSIGESGIMVGSVEEMVNAVTNMSTSTSSDDVPGIIITNPGQLIWCRSEGRAISYSEYLNIPRISAVHGPFRIDPSQNRVAGNTSYEEHVEYIFENVMMHTTHPEVKFDIIGLEYSGGAVVHYLKDHWAVWRNRIDGICLGNPQFRVKDFDYPLVKESDFNDFVDFLGKRVRAYFVSDKPTETALPGRSEHGCNCYASGEEFYEDGILVKGWRSMLDWFNMISILHDHEEPIFTLIEKDG